MPKANKKSKNNRGGDGLPEKRKLLEKDEDEHEYARVTKVLGNARYSLKLSMSGKTVIGKLRGAMRGGKRKKANFVRLDSVVLVAMRTDMTSDNVVDIIHVYDHSEVRTLKKEGKFVEIEDGRERPEDVKEDDIEDCVFDFEDL